MSGLHCYAIHMRPLELERQYLDKLSDDGVMSRSERCLNWITYVNWNHVIYNRCNLTRDAPAKNECVKLNVTFFPFCTRVKVADDAGHKPYSLPKKNGIVSKTVLN